jgi:hypothetical protein
MIPTVLDLTDITVVMFVFAKKRVICKIAGSGTRADVNSKQLKFTLQDGSCGLHISESTVSISYTLRYQRALVS